MVLAANGITSRLRRKRRMSLGFLQVFESSAVITGMFVTRQTSTWVCRKTKPNKNLLEFRRKLTNGWNLQQVKSVCVSGSA